MPKLEFFVIGDPKAQPRCRVFSKHGVTRVYDPGTANGWKASIRAEAMQEWHGRKPLSGPVSLSLIFWFKRPKSHYSKCLLKPDAPPWHTQKPDLDNLEKAIMDALTKAKVWTDDCLVVDKNAEKRWAMRDDVPGVSVYLFPMDEKVVQ